MRKVLSQLLRIEVVWIKFSFWGLVDRVAYGFNVVIVRLCWNYVVFFAFYIFLYAFCFFWCLHIL
jgi:hypothetical protein